MKNGNSRKLSLLGIAMLLPLVGACRPEAANPPPPTAAATSAPVVEQPVVADATQAEQVVTAEAAEAADPAEPATPEIDLANAPVKPITTEKALPPTVRPYGPVAEVIKLTSSSVDESVLLAYVTNSPHLFNPTADEIIYLNDLGIPSSVVTAMMQHDQALRQAGVTADPTPDVAAAPAPGAPPAGPAPEQVAPQYAPQPEVAAAPAPTAAPAAPAAVSYAAPTVAVSEPVFYDSLSPYGTWVEVEGYGRCWQPSVVVVNPGWQPYYDGGHWVYTDCGWYWASDYSWGWAPFHYGRWFRHHRMGWCWAPDSVWGPSWVCWRYSDVHCGWAPLPPGAWFRPGIGLTFHGRHVDASFSFGLSFDCFTFVAIGHLGDAHLHGRALARVEARRAFEHSVVHARFDGDRHRPFNHGLPPERFTAVTHKPLRPVSIRESQAPPTHGGRPDRIGNDGKSLTVYRPPMNNSNPTRSAASSGAGSTTGKIGGRPQPNTTPDRMGSIPAQARNGTGSTTERVGGRPQPNTTPGQMGGTPPLQTRNPNPRAVTPTIGKTSASGTPGKETVSTGNPATPSRTANPAVTTPRTANPAATTAARNPTTTPGYPARSGSTIGTTPQKPSTGATPIGANPASSPVTRAPRPATTTTPSASQWTANRLETPKTTTPSYPTANRYTPPANPSPAPRQASPSYQAPQAPRYSPPAQSESRPSSSYRAPSEAPRSSGGQSGGGSPRSGGSSGSSRQDRDRR